MKKKYNILFMSFLTMLMFNNQLWAAGSGNNVIRIYLTSYSYVDDSLYCKKDSINKAKNISDGSSVFKMLVSAIDRYDVDGLNELLNSNASFSKENLRYAIELSQMYQMPQILKSLLSHKYKITVSDSVYDGYGFGDKDAYYDCMKLLLKYEPSYRCQYMCTDDNIDERLRFYLSAVKKEDYEVLDLINFQTDIALDWNSCEGETLLTVAVKNNNARMVKYLLDRGIDKEKREVADCSDDSIDGENAYEIARNLGFNDIMKLLEQY